MPRSMYSDLGPASGSKTASDSGTASSSRTASPWRFVSLLALAVLLGSSVTNSASAATFKRVLAEQFGATW
ncbi:MAG: hypothetical protein KDA27_24175 [Candidatus Eisenbacteria bacterium]|uniref:Uncharacterized protein n=1 Tax=Eiseniibacteriota bacterium TaxID=2212470 RepID=A0A956SGR2_UNCEI|nr:hypothetical protein [Candidatus Eisenbacteria bacterium]